MDSKELRGLMEAYSEVYAPEQLDEVLDTPQKANEYARKNVRSMLGAFAKGVANKDISQLKTIEKRKRGAELGKRKAERKAAEEQKESFDIFDVVLEFLQAEGYAETLEEAEWLMANELDSEDIEAIIEAVQLDEISQKTATSAYAASKTGEFEGADSDRDIKRSDNLRRHIKRKFGAGAAKHADRAADSMTFGRKDASGKSKGLPKSRIEKSDYRTTQDGKMHKQDQKELKTNLRIKRDRRLRAERELKKEN